ncbi:MAG: AIR synthase related protein, partial [Nitrospira sp.]|nr:AIR synthase related protein [Nitrospira sp.]
MASTARLKSRNAIHEFALIHTLRQQHGRHDPSVIRGIGDDAAVVTSGNGSWSLLTTDLLAEGIHFDLRTATMADIGFRAAAANLSDIAAMGGQPQYLLVSLA